MLSHYRDNVHQNHRR